MMYRAVKDVSSPRFSYKPTGFGCKSFTWGVSAERESEKEAKKGHVLGTLTTADDSSC